MSELAWDPKKELPLLKPQLLGPELKVTLEVWTLHDLVSYLQSIPKENFYRESPPGFEIFSNRFLYREVDASEYPDPKTLPQWQQQDTGECNESNFDRSIVARVGQEVVGILHCEWMRFRRDISFWGYNLCFVEVSSKWQERGIGKSLIQELDTQDWLQGRILWRTRANRLGHERLAHVFRREMKAENYILLEADYPNRDLPSEAGWYGRDS